MTFIVTVYVHIFQYRFSFLLKKNKKIGFSGLEMARSHLGSLQDTIMTQQVLRTLIEITSLDHLD